MNINISQITNGFIVAISVPNKGQSAIHYASFDEVLKALAELIDPPSNVTEMPKPTATD
jgi:hypothetical protein